MKKVLATILALVMALSVTATAWATEGGTEGGAGTTSGNFYQDTENEYVWHIKNLEGLKEFRANLQNDRWQAVGNYWSDGQNERLKKEAYYGYTIVLDSDIDMSGENWEPIGGVNDPWRFNGTFDGQNHTISNMKIDSNGDNVGFFGFLEPGREQGLRIQNLKFDNAKVSGGENVAVLAGAANLFSEFNNITVTNSTVSGTKNIAGIVGYTLNGEKINAITIESTKLYASEKRVGGIAGYVCNSANRVSDGCGGAYEKCSVKNLTIAKGTANNAWPAESGYLFGLLNSDGGTTLYKLTNCRVNGKLVPAATVEQAGDGTRAPHTALGVTVFCYGADNVTNVSIICTETDPTPSTGGYYYYQPTTDTKTNDTTKGSPKTFDAGVGIYAVTAVLSVTGMAWTAKKRGN